MFTIDIKHEFSDAKTIEKLIAQSLSMSVSASAKATKATADYMQRIRKAALRITAARTRKNILRVFDNNLYGWAEHRNYPNWFGKFGQVSMAGLIAANRPIKTTTRKGNKRKRGYSTSKIINPPRNYPLGGRLKRGTRYKVEEDNMIVGILPTAQPKVQNKMSLFQDGGIISVGGDVERSRRYLAALGLYFRRNTFFKAKPRPLYEPLRRESPPQSIFVEAYSGLLEDRLRLGED